MNIHMHMISMKGMEITEPGYTETNPLGGSETACLRLGYRFGELGHNVTWSVVKGNDPVELDDVECDVFISCRDWRAIGAVHSDRYKLSYLWGQDDTEADAMKPLIQNKPLAKEIFQHYDSIVLLSRYQISKWAIEFEIPREKIFRSTNGVDFTHYQNVRPTADRPRRCYYASTPFRGLDMLAEAWPLVRKAVPDAELHVFSSMRLYGGDAAQYGDIVEKARSLEGQGVIVHDVVGQSELRETALTCRAMAYPCTFPETSCITAMEAMAAGCVVVGNDIGCLSETAWLNPMSVPGEYWLNQWAMELCKVLVDDEYYLDIARQNVITSQFYDYRMIANRWLKRIAHDAMQKGISLPTLPLPTIPPPKGDRP